MDEHNQLIENGWLIPEAKIYKTSAKRREQKRKWRAKQALAKRQAILNGQITVANKLPQEKKDALKLKQEVKNNRKNKNLLKKAAELQVKQQNSDNPQAAKIEKDSFASKKRPMNVKKRDNNMPNQVIDLTKNNFKWNLNNWNFNASSQLFEQTPNTDLNFVPTRINEQNNITTNPTHKYYFNLDNTNIEVVPITCDQMLPQWFDITSKPKSNMINQNACDTLPNFFSNFSALAQPDQKNIYAEASNNSYSGGPTLITTSDTPVFQLANLVPTPTATGSFAIGSASQTLATTQNYCDDSNSNLKIDNQFLSEQFQEQNASTKDDNNSDTYAKYAAEIAYHQVSHNFNNDQEMTNDDIQLKNYIFS